MSEIEVTQADRDCEEKIIKAMVSSSFLPGCFAAAHRQAAMIEGARRMQELAAKVSDEFYDNSLRLSPPTQQKIASTILALDPASIVEKNHD